MNANTHMEAAIARRENEIREDEIRVNRIKDNQSQDLAVEPNETLRAAGEAPDGVTGHTSLPWRVSMDHGFRYVRSPDNHIVATVESLLNGIDNDAKEVEAATNAELIVKAVNSYATFIAAAKAALEYVDDLNENTPVDMNCKECIGRVFFTKGTPEPPLCWIHQLEKVVKESK